MKPIDEQMSEDVRNVVATLSDYRSIPRTKPTAGYDEALDDVLQAGERLQDILAKLIQEAERSWWDRVLDWFGRLWRKP